MNGETTEDLFKRSNTNLLFAVKELSCYLSVNASYLNLSIRPPIIWSLFTPDTPYPTSQVLRLLHSANLTTFTLETTSASCRANKANHTPPFRPLPTPAAPTHRAIRTPSLQSRTRPVQPFIRRLKWLGSPRRQRLLDCRPVGPSRWKAWMGAGVLRMWALRPIESTTRESKMNMRRDPAVLERWPMPSKAGRWRMGLITGTTEWYIVWYEQVLVLLAAEPGGSSYDSLFRVWRAAWSSIVDTQA